MKEKRRLPSEEVMPQLQECIHSIEDIKIQAREWKRGQEERVSEAHKGESLTPSSKACHRDTAIQWRIRGIPTVIFDRKTTEEAESW